MVFKGGRVAAPLALPFLPTFSASNCCCSSFLRWAQRGNSKNVGCLSQVNMGYVGQGGHEWNMTRSLCNVKSVFWKRNIEHQKRWPTGTLFPHDTFLRSGTPPRAFTSSPASTHAHPADCVPSHLLFVQLSLEPRQLSRLLPQLDAQVMGLGTLLQATRQYAVQCTHEHNSSAVHTG